METLEGKIRKDSSPTSREFYTLQFENVSLFSVFFLSFYGRTRPFIFELRVYEVLYMSCFYDILHKNKCLYNKPINCHVTYAHYSNEVLSPNFIKLNFISYINKINRHCSYNCISMITAQFSTKYIRHLPYFLDGFSKISSVGYV